jgi:hypothetical protein
MGPVQEDSDLVELLHRLVEGLAGRDIEAVSDVASGHDREHAAGPVYVSQVGYVGTAVGLASGALVFGESYSFWIWAASGVITAGVLIVNSSRRL